MCVSDDDSDDDLDDHMFLCNAKARIIIIIINTVLLDAEETTRAHNLKNRCDII